MSLVNVVIIVPPALLAWREPIVHYGLPATVTCQLRPDWCILWPLVRNVS